MRRWYTLIGSLAIGLSWSVGFAQAEPTVKLQPGDTAPSFSAKDADGHEWSSDRYLGKQPLVVYFYPAALTGGCTKQACTYRDDLPKLKGANAELIAISGDQPENLRLFRKAHNLNFTLLSDPDGSVARKFGVPVKEGGEIKQTVEGEDVTLKRGVTASRWTFVIDKGGKIAYVNREVDPAQDSQAVLAVLEKLSD